MTIVVGFSILSMSEFVPLVYFGLFIALAMIVALLSALTFLPQLLRFLKPLGKEGPQEMEPLSDENLKPAAAGPSAGMESNAN